jgi:hypothetical protein
MRSRGSAIDLRQKVGAGHFFSLRQVNMVEADAA